MKTVSAIFLLGTTALWLAASPAAAQTAEAKPTPPSTTEPQDDTTSSELPDIIIRATRTGETNLQDTPVAVTAFSPAALKERGVTTALDLNGLAPNVSIGGRSGTGATSGAVTIRGIGIDANSPAQPAVGIYVDEVYIPAAFGNLLGTYDLAQVEILRGPQGTLFGRNTISGALIYTSIKPRIGELSAFVEGTVGNQKRGDVSGGINLPLTSWAALRFSGAYTNRDGYVRDLRNGVYRGSEHNSDFRVQLRLQPASNLVIDLKAEQVHQESNGPASTQRGFNYTAILGRPFAPIPPSTVGGLDRFISPNYYTTYGYDGPVGFTSTIKIGQGVIAYDITPDIKIKSISAYSKTTDLLSVDGDGTPLALFANTRGNDLDKLFTQEFQLSGNSFSKRFHWALGLYYYHDKFSNSNAVASIFGGPFANTTFGNYTVNTKSYAAYGQATLDITDELSVVGGLRYTKDDISVVNTATTRYGLTNVTFKNWSPLVGINFHITDDILLYAKWSRGFRAGNFSPNLYAVNAFGPETAETYEAGTRMEFFNKRVRINPTVFSTKWNNVQFNASTLYLPPLAPTPTPAPIIQNAGNVRTKGAEVEMQFAVTKYFTLNANGALFEGHYTSLLLGPDPDGPGPLVATPIANVTLGTPLKRAPKSSFAVGGRYEVPVGDGNVALSANYAWQATQRSATSNNDSVQIPAYGLLSARLAYTAPDNLFVISIWSNNLANQKYIISGTTYGKGGLIPTTDVVVGRPREFGLTARFNLR